MTERYIKEKNIREFFTMLNEENIQYALIKNIAAELPSNLKDGKDIDIIVKLEDRERFALAMVGHGWLYRVPPLGRVGEWNFAYKLPEYQFWQLSGIAERFYVDACFKLMCKSLTPKTWVPLNVPLQEKAWAEREWNEELQCWQLGEKTLFVYLFLRCVFDKRAFSDAYIAEIEKRKNLIDDGEVKALLESEFFKFTDTLIALAENREYGAIVDRYITFQNY